MTFEELLDQVLTCSSAGVRCPIGPCSANSTWMTPRSTMSKQNCSTPIRN